MTRGRSARAFDGSNQFFMLDGTINNQVLQGSGNDMATILGGTITQQVSTGAGNDQLLWSGGSIGAHTMGSGADIATLRNLTSTISRALPSTAASMPIA